MKRNIMLLLIKEDERTFILLGHVLQANLL